MTKAELEAENARLNKENEQLKNAAATGENGGMTVAELKAENKRLADENTELRNTQTDKTINTAIEGVTSGSCPNCGFNAEVHRELVKSANL